MDCETISRVQVLALLRSLARDQLARQSPLAGLQFVRDSLERAGFAPSPKACEVELCRLVEQLVETELTRLRKENDWDRHTTGLGDRGHIKLDFAVGNRELEAWSALHYVYLRPDLDLTLDRFVAVVQNRHRRTVQRRLRRGVDALTARLQAHERSAVRAAGRNRAIARIPTWPTSRRSVSQEAANSAVALLCAGTGPAAIALGGPHGIGKTSLASLLARRAVEARVFEDVVWISVACVGKARLRSSTALLRTIAMHLGLEKDTPGHVVRSALAVRATLVVVDGIDDVSLASAVSASLGSLVWPSRALLTGTVGWCVVGQIRWLDVPTLDRASTLSLLRHEARLRGLGEVAVASDSDLAPIACATSGLPAAICLAVDLLQSMDLGGVLSDFDAAHGRPAELYRKMHEEAWSSSSEEARHIASWIVKLCRSSAVCDSGTIASAGSLPRTETYVALREALARGLVTPAGSERHRVYQPALFLDRFLRSQGVSNADAWCAHGFRSSTAA